MCINQPENKCLFFNLQRTICISQYHLPFTNTKINSILHARRGRSNSPPEAHKAAKNKLHVLIKGHKCWAPWSLCSVFLKTSSLLLLASYTLPVSLRISMSFHVMPSESQWKTAESPCSLNYKCSPLIWKNTSLHWSQMYEVKFVHARKSR